ncbi:uncharacterized protein [Narcine bancroftii]|uniref:uncharacterized protein isoform X3 n=1 Tax=Narcine bancroftii TaxID=1343680 RepID=UPI003831AE40
MEYFETDRNLNTPGEMDNENSEDLLEKMDDYQFISYVENHCGNFQKSLGITEDEWIKQGTNNSLLCEKSFDHEIFSNVDDNFNLNFNDICDSYTICLSQSSSSEDVSFNITADDIYTIKNEYDGSDEDERINSEEINIGQNQEIHSSNNSDTHDEIKDKLEGYNCQDIGASTSDEEQTELFYDGNFKNVSEHHTDKKIELAYHVPPFSRLVANPSGHGSVSGMNHNIQLNERSFKKNMFSKQEVSDIEVNSEDEASSHEHKNEFSTITSEKPIDMLKTRHGAKLENTYPLSSGKSNTAKSALHFFFEEDQAFSSTMYIDSETLPETSDTDSIEETVIINHNSSNSSNDLFMENDTFSKLESDKKKETDGKFKSKLLVQVKDGSHCKRYGEGNVENNSACRKKTSCLETPQKIMEENLQAPSGGKTATEIAQNPKMKMGRTISYNEIKYGKGKKHYPLLDFSKVASRIKIPKRTICNNYNCPTSTFKKGKSSPNSSENPHAIHNSIINRVQNVPVIAAKTEVNNQKHEDVNQTPEHFQQLQEEFDKLLIKYAEAENTIDQLRFGGKVTATSDLSKSSQLIHSGILSSPCQLTFLTSQQEHKAESGCINESITFFPLESTNNCSRSLSVTSVGYKQDSCQSISEVSKTTGEQMAQKLSKQIEYFKHQELKGLRDGQDKLERIYIATKDEHRNLQHRGYLEKNTTVGEFDPDREIEGEIFRLGMALENIKEKIDEDICNQSSSYDSIPELSSVYYGNSKSSITQDGPREAQKDNSVNDESATWNNFQMEMMKNENNSSPLLKDACNHIPQRQSPIVPTKAESNIKSSLYHADLCLNRTSDLQSTSFQGQELLNEFKSPILFSDSGLGTSEDSRPTTATQALDSEQPQIKRNPSFHEQVSSSKLKLCKENSRTSLHTDENVIEVRQLLPAAVPMGCTTPFNWDKPITGVVHSPAQGDAFLELDFLTEYSDDHIPLPNPQRYTPQIKCYTEENESLYQPGSTRNAEILELQQEVSKLKQKLEESLSKLSNGPKTTKAFEPLLQKQSYDIKSCCRNKTSPPSLFCNGGSMEHIELTTNDLKDYTRGHPTCIQTDVDASDGELSTGHGMDFFFLMHKHLSTQNKVSWRHQEQLTKNKEHSGRSSRQIRHELTSSAGISSIGANKYSEILTSISPIRYTIEYPPLSRSSRIYYSPSYEIIKTGLQCYPNQICSTKYFWRNHIEKNISIPQIAYLNTNLDKAIEAANNMKKTTRRMVNNLSADLAKADYYKYVHHF